MGYTIRAEFFCGLLISYMDDINTTMYKKLIKNCRVRKKGKKETGEGCDPFRQARGRVNQEEASDMIVSISSIGIGL